jgi:hypothetical protein
MSDKVYHPLSKAAVTKFLDWDKTITRLKDLKDGEFAGQVKELQSAIEQSE